MPLSAVTVSNVTSERVKLAASRIEMTESADVVTLMIFKSDIVKEFSGCEVTINRGDSVVVEITSMSLISSDRLSLRRSNVRAV